MQGIAEQIYLEFINLSPTFQSTSEETNFQVFSLL